MSKENKRKYNALLSKGKIYSVIQKLIIYRSEHMLSKGKSNKEWYQDGNLNNQMILNMICAEICNMIHSQFDIELDKIEAKICQQFQKEDNERETRIIAYSTRRKINIGEPIDSDYRIVNIFSTREEITLLTPEEVKNGFTYKEIPGEKSAEERQKEETIQQYLAIPLYTMKNTIIGVLEVPFYERKINDREAEFIIENILKPYGDFIQILLFEQLAIQNRIIRR